MCAVWIGDVRPASKQDCHESESDRYPHSDSGYSQTIHSSGHMSRGSLAGWYSQSSLHSVSRPCGAWVWTKAACWTGRLRYRRQAQCMSTRWSWHHYLIGSAYCSPRGRKYIPVTSDPDLDSSMRATRRTRSKIKVLKILVPTQQTTAGMIYKNHRTKIPERPIYWLRDIGSLQTTCIGMNRMMASVAIFGICIYGT